MNRFNLINFLLLFVIIWGCDLKKVHDQDSEELFPPELVEFVPYPGNPVFMGTGKDTWDRFIRERGYILWDEGIFKMWYTGYDSGANATKYLGYATSMDGLEWTRYPGNPIFDEYWTEDMMVIKQDDRYFMVAEGVNDIAHMLISSDGIHWQRAGDLDIRKVDGTPIDPGPYGTPTLWFENGTWYLYYERNDLGIWLATSADHQTWTNVQDDPVIERGPDPYDAEAVALDQIIKYQGKYYAYYHASPDENWATWNSDIAVSDDLITWAKYENNPILSPEGPAKDISSPILVYDGKKYRLYSMHDKVRVFFPRESDHSNQSKSK